MQASSPFGTVAPLEEEYVAQRLLLRGVEIADDHLPLLRKLHEYCLRENTGVEYLLLLLVSPFSLAEMHLIRPQRLMRNLLCEIPSDSDVVKDNCLAHDFAEELSRYVQAMSDIPNFGRTMQLADPGPECLVGLFDAGLRLRHYSDIMPVLTNIVHRLHELQILPPGDSLQATVRHTANEIEVRFTLGIFGTVFTHARVAETLRRDARKRLPTLRAGSEQHVCCEALALMPARWDGVFSENLGAPEPLAEQAAAGEGRHSVLHYDPVEAIFRLAAWGPHAALPIRQYTNRVQSMLAEEDDIF